MGKQNVAAPEEWKEYLKWFGCQVIASTCESIVTNYKHPITDDLSLEVINQHDMVCSKLKCDGIRRDDVIAAVTQYCSFTARDRDRDPYKRQALGEELGHVPLHQGGTTLSRSQYHSHLPPSRHHQTLVQCCECVEKCYSSAGQGAGQSHFS